MKVVSAYISPQILRIFPFIFKWGPNGTGRLIDMYRGFRRFLGKEEEIEEGKNKRKEKKKKEKSNKVE